MRRCRPGVEPMRGGEVGLGDAMNRSGYPAGFKRVLPRLERPGTIGCEKLVGAQAPSCCPRLALAGRRRYGGVPAGRTGMITEPRPERYRLAVLIDADNASARIADGLFEEVAKLGEASVRRIYGDFASSRLKSWSDILSKHAIIPQQNFAYTAGKNASDIALVIDAMDLMHSGRFDGFCLVSSDSDFTRLASRLREQGADVYGFGEQKTPESFRQACRRFIYTENLLPDAPATP